MIGNLEASVVEGVHEGTCVMLTNDDVKHIVYAGPICYCPPTDGMLLLLHQTDFDQLQAAVIVNRKQKLN